MSKKLKIALIGMAHDVCDPKGNNPQHSHIAVLANALVSRGHDVTLYGAPSPACTAKTKSLYGRPLAPIVRDAPRDVQLQFRDLFNMDHDLWALHDAMKSGADLVHAHNVPMFVMQRQITIPLVFTMHVGFANMDKASLTGLLGLLGISKRAHFICISESQRAQYPDDLPASVVHHTIDFPSFPVGEKSRDYLLYLGRVSPEKGVHVAMQVAARAGLPLKIAGTVTDEGYFERKVKPLFGSGVEYLGQVGFDRKVELYGGAIATLCPAQWKEPFGLVMLESMACGTPVIATRNGSPPEVITDGVTGFLADDAEQMAACIPKLRQLSPAAVRAHAEEKFSLDRFGAGYEQAYQAAIDGFPRG